jgi:hypothetical protein
MRENLKQNFKKYFILIIYLINTLYINIYDIFLLSSYLHGIGLVFKKEYLKTRPTDVLLLCHQISILHLMILEKTGYIQITRELIIFNI